MIVDYQTPLITAIQSIKDGTWSQILEYTIKLSYWGLCKNTA